MKDCMQLDRPCAAIDFGISNTDVVAFVGGEQRVWSQPAAGDPSPESVRALLASHGVALADLDHLAVTGGRHRLLPEQINGTPVVSVGELAAISRGGQAMAGLSAATLDTPLIVMSAGSGTAIMAARGDDYQHVTGSGVGGGTMLGLSRLLLGVVDPREIDALALAGDANGVDLALRDVVMGPIGSLPPETTAVNFGRLGREAFTPQRTDLAAAIVTMVGQVVGTLAINAARARQIDQVVVTGHMTDMVSMRAILEQVGGFFGLSLTLPPRTGYATALGALLYAAEHT